MNSRYRGRNLRQQQRTPLPSWHVAAYADLHRLTDTGREQHKTMVSWQRRNFSGQLIVLQCTVCGGFRRQHCIALGVLQELPVGCKACCHASVSRTAASGAVYIVYNTNTYRTYCIHYIGKRLKISSADWQDMTVLSLAEPQGLLRWPCCHQWQYWP